MQRTTMIEKEEKPDFASLYKEYVSYSKSCDNETSYTLAQFESLLSGKATPEEYQKFRAINHTLNAIDTVKHGPNLLGFSPLNLNPSGFGTGINLFDQVLGVAGDIAGRTVRDLAGRGARAVVERAEDAVERFKTRSAGLGGPGGTSVIGNRAEGFGANGETSAFAMNTEPMKVEFLTGVSTTMYPPIINAPTYTVGSTTNNDERQVTADMACIVLHLPPDNEYARTYWESVYVPNIQLRAQSSVGFNINAGVNFTYQKVTTYFNLLFTALSKYFFMANTYSVIQGPGQRDLSRNKIRQMFQTSDLQYLRLLKERLDALPIPPAMISEVANMYSVYKTNINSDCSNTISFTPVPLTAFNQEEPVFNVLTMGLQATIHELGTLDDPTNPTRTTVDMMSRVFPEWVATTVNPTQTFPEFSDKFLARFINSPGSQSTYVADNDVSLTLNFPFVSYDNEHTKFAISQKFEQDEIGDIQASCSIWNATKGDWSGTMVPSSSSYLFGLPTPTTRYTNRYSFCFYNGSMEWIPSNYSGVNGPIDFETLPMRQPYVNYLAGIRPHYTAPFGTYELTGNSINAMSQPSIDWLGKLFDVDSFTAKKFSADRKPRGKKKSYGKKKGRGKMESKEEEVA
jgi:hypothetical protein